MAVQVERLIATLEARLDKYERGLARAQGVSDRQFGRIERRGKQMEGRLAALGATAFRPFMAAATATLAPILSVAGALNGAKAAMEEFDRIGKAAKRGGVDSEFFQGLAYQAQLAGASMGDVSSALETFARNVGQAESGRGRLVSGLKDLDAALLRNIQTARTQEERLRLVADALNRTEDPTRRAAIAQAAFGGAAAQMIQVLKGGSAAIDDTARKARNLGIIIDRELIARAEELNDEFSTATRIMDLQFKQALINLAPVIIGIAERAARLAGDIRYLIDQMKELEDRSTSTLTSNVVDVDRERLDIENQILAIRQQQRELTGSTAVLESRLLDGTIAALEERLAALTEKGATIETILTTRRDNRPPLSPIDPGEDIPELPGGGRASSRNAAADAAIREAEAVRDLIASLEHELSVIGLSDVEKAKSNALRQAGAAATPEQREEIERLVEAIHRETAAIEASKQAHEDRITAIENGMNMVGNGLADIFLRSEDASEAVKRLAIQLALAVAQAALLGKGPLAGLFGGGGGLLGGILGGASAMPAAASSISRAALPAASGVLSRAPAMSPSIAAAGTAGGRGMEMTLRVVGEAGPMFIPTIQAESRDVAVRVVKANDTARNRYWQSGGQPK